MDSKAVYRIAEMQHAFRGLTPAERQAATEYMLGFAAGYVPDESRWQRFISASIAHVKDPATRPMATGEGAEPIAAAPVPPPLSEIKSGKDAAAGPDK